MQCNELLFNFLLCMQLESLQRKRKHAVKLRARSYLERLLFSQPTGALQHVCKTLQKYPEFAFEQFGNDDCSSGISSHTRRLGNECPLLHLLVAKAPLPVIKEVHAMNPSVKPIRTAKHGLRMYPLHVALLYGNSPDVVAFLLSKNSEAARQKDRYGCLPIHYASSNCVKGQDYLKILQLVAHAYPEGLLATREWLDPWFRRFCGDCSPLMYAIAEPQVPSDVVAVLARELTMTQIEKDDNKLLFQLNRGLLLPGRPKMDWSSPKWGILFGNLRSKIHIALKDFTITSDDLMALLFIMTTDFTPSIALDRCTITAPRNVYPGSENLSCSMVKDLTFRGCRLSKDALHWLLQSFKRMPLLNQVEFCVTPMRAVSTKECDSITQRRLQLDRFSNWGFAMDVESLTETLRTSWSPANIVWAPLIFSSGDEDPVEDDPDFSMQSSNILYYSKRNICTSKIERSGEAASAVLVDSFDDVQTDTNLPDALKLSVLFELLLRSPSLWVS